MLALGAKAVMLGRAAVYALAAQGQAGVENLLDLFAKEIRIAMTLTGATSINQINESNLVLQRT
jgi:L-lactate dehydrogenase (cytochrome)